MKTLIMGVINTTPDSFSDGGKFYSPQAAIEHGVRLSQEGADWLDVGGESTRPGAAPVSVEEECARVLTVVRALAERGHNVSIDTRNPETAAQALSAGAKMINDVTGFQDSAMRTVVKEHHPAVCVMHMQGQPQTMQQDPTYDDVVADVKSFLVHQAQQLEGLAADVWIDPGIGFGKTLEHNLELIRSLESFVQTGYPVLLGVSRKSFLGKILGDAPVDCREEATLAVQVLAQQAGVQMVRTHDVQKAARVRATLAALL